MIQSAINFVARRETSAVFFIIKFVECENVRLIDHPPAHLNLRHFRNPSLSDIPECANWRKRQLGYFFLKKGAMHHGAVANLRFFFGISLGIEILINIENYWYTTKFKSMFSYLPTYPEINGRQLFLMDSSVPIITWSLVQWRHQNYVCYTVGNFFQFT